MNTTIFRNDLFFFFLVTLFGFTLFLGNVPLFDWDEINFAESAREMIVSKNYFQVQINFEPFWEKPPLFFWLQCISMQIFGVNEFAARIPNALIGILTVIYLYWLGNRWKGILMARILAALYAASFLPAIYFKSGIIDPVFNFFIFVALFHLFQFEVFKSNAEDRKNQLRPWWVGIFLGLATLTKGPACILIVGATYFIYKAFFDRKFHFLAIGKIILMFSLLVFGWYGFETLVHGSWFVEKFITYQIRLFTQEDAGHGQPFYYHLLIFTFGCFPLSIFTFRGMFQKYEDEKDNLLKHFMLIWFWVVMILFSIAKTKIIHYSSLLYFPAAFLSALFLLEKIKTNKKMPFDVYFLFVLGMLLWGVAPSFINVISSNLDKIISILPENREKMFVKGILSANVVWSGYEYLIGIVFLIGLLFNVFYLFQKKYLHFIYLQLFLTLFLINGEYYFVLPKIAKYTQGANVEFFSNLANKDVYFLTANYKSYTPYFYGKIKPLDNPNAYNNDWLIEGAIDKDVYISAKNIAVNEDFLKRYHLFTKLYEAGGFVFFVRKK